MKKDFLFIINPVSGNGNGKNAAPVISKFMEVNNISFDILFTEYPKHAVKLCENKQIQYKNVVAVGGDGTINEVLNGLRSDLVENFSIIPVGSGNDLARALKLSYDINSNLELLLKNRPINIDFGEIECKTETGKNIKTRFINSVGIGFDALVAHTKQTNKKFSGNLSYIHSIMHSLGKKKSLKAKVWINNSSKCFELSNKMIFAVGNGESAGGGLYLTPGGIMNDSKFDLTVIDDLTISNLLLKFPYLFNKKIYNLKQVQHFNFEKLLLKLSSPYFVHMDGEIICDNLTEIKIKLIKNKLKILSYAF